MPEIFFNIATVERRHGMFMDVLKMLSTQTVSCDKINIAMSCKHLDPDIIRTLQNHFKSYHVFHKPMLQCEFKMFAIHSLPKNAYFLHFDDDIIYPPDYAERIIDGIEKYKRESVVGFHGIKFDHFPVTEYKKQKTMFQYFKTVEEDTRVDVIGTGCLGFYIGTIIDKGFQFDNIKKINCLDGAFGRWCRDTKIQTMVLKHEADWMKIYPNSQDMTALWKRSWKERYKTKLSFLQQ